MVIMLMSVTAVSSIGEHWSKRSCLVWFGHSHVNVTGILVLKILVPRTKIFAGKYGPPLEKSVEDPHFRPSFSNKRI